MRKRIVIFLVMLGLSVAAGAQGSSAVTKKVFQGALKKSGKGRVERAVARTAPKVPVAPRAASRLTPRAQAQAISSRAAQKAALSHQADIAGASVKVFKQAAQKRTQLLEKVQKELEKRRSLQNQWFETGIGRSVLFAPVESEGKTGGFSVTVVKTQVNGQEEVFGVIASHVLPESYYTFHSSLKRSFHVSIKQPDGTEQLLPAEVVQVSPRSMMDISLVKFPKEAEQLLHPLELDTTPAADREELFSYGFKAGQPDQENRVVQKQSFLSVRTDQNLAGSRQGFCGSPLLNRAGQVKAIHTGTKEIKNAQDISYGTHAKFINLLVQAYHNDGQALYDFVMDGHALATLNVDEYISAVYLYDKTGKRLVQKNIEEKFPETFLRQTLAQYPQAAYLQLTSRKAQWETDQDGDSILKEDRSKNDKTKRQHWYNLQTRQIEPARPAVIKM